MNVYEMLGRAQEQLAIAHQEYVNLWSLVQRIKDGEVNVQDVQLTQEGEQHKWSLSPNGQNASPEISDTAQ